MDLNRGFYELQKQQLELDVIQLQQSKSTYFNFLQTHVRQQPFVGLGTNPYSAFENVSPQQFIGLSYGIHSNVSGFLRQLRHFKSLLL